MKLFYTKAAFLFLIAGFFSFQSQAQYCTPVINSSGIYLSQINFLTYGDVAGGQAYSTASGGYTQTLGTSAGTVKRYFGGSFFYSISNPGASTKPYDFRLYADWNNDGDFNDAGEQCFVITGNVAPGSSTTGNQVYPPLNLTPGDYRLRFAVSESGAAGACGPYTGEVEDYKITIAANTAPVLNTAAVTYINPLLSTATNSNGISVSEFINSSEPAAKLISDADDKPAGGWYDLVPRGIAIYGQTAVNGTWQYKVGAGAWTNFGAVSGTNALLLMADASFTTYQPASRIRFVPTGTGTPTFTYRAWDGTSGTNGSYANIVSTGGTSAYSTANLTASLPVIAATGFSNNIYFSTSNNTIYSALLNKSSLAIANSEPLLTNAAQYYSGDIAMDNAANKLFWVSGTGADNIASSTLTGTGVQTALVPGMVYSSGLAAGGGKLFYFNYSADFTRIDIYRSNYDGTGVTQLTTGSGHLNGATVSDSKDIEFYNNKIYFQYFDGTNFNIGSSNTDGSGFTQLYSTAIYFGGLAVSDGYLYWTETDGTVKKRLITGGAVTTLATSAGRILGDLIVDANMAQVYFIETDAANPNYSQVRRVAVSGGAVVNVLSVSGLVNSLTFNASQSLVPVTLVDFSGQLNDAAQVALLQWKTAAETGFDHFELERSTDGMQYSFVAAVAAAGGGASLHDYNYNDNLGGLHSDKYYYRLKMVDEDGRFQYSNVVLLRSKAEDIAVRVSSNPGAGMYNVQLGLLPAAGININVYNAAGQMIYADKISSLNYQLNLKDKAAGTYYMQLSGADGVKKQVVLVKR